jgi:poly(3-hydroxybutyrate) depolymerase
MSHAALKPARAAAEHLRYLVENPFNPFSQTAAGRHAAAACEMFERTTRRYARPSFGLTTTRIGNRDVAVGEEVIWERPFCRLIHFRREMPTSETAADPRILLVAPMSGHFATLLRGTVEALLPNHEVFITDWQDARTVPAASGGFGLDDYVDYVREMLSVFQGDVHVFAVCQSAVPTMAAVSLMEEDADQATPRSMIFAGGPIDTRVSPTAVNDVAVDRGTDWFARHVITTVPWPYEAAGRQVYPGFLQLSGFMSMNLDRHANAHKELFLHLIRGDGDSAEKHRTFYDEYLAVMDLTAEFYLDTIDAVFVRHALPKGEMMHRGRRVDPSRILRTALMTIEGENDDITGLGQCRAAQDLCTGLADEMKLHVECADVGHYGIFNGSRFRGEIAPRIAQFVRTFDPRAELIPTQPVSRRPVAQSVGGYDPSAAAFTFAPANDLATAPQTAGSR